MYYSWDLLRNLAFDNGNLWLVMGDFNKIMYSYGKKGGRLKEEQSMEAFRSALDDCDL